MWSVESLREILNGAGKEIFSVQETKLAEAVTTYTRKSGASRIEIYVESGSIRVRTDGSAATISTGEPMAAGVGGAFTVKTLSVYTVANAVYTVVHR